MRISDSPFLHGLSLAERHLIVHQAAAEQQVEIDRLVDDLFAGVNQATQEATRPLSYWSGLARDNARNPAVNPVDFWAHQEAVRRERAEASRRYSMSAMFGTGPGSPIRPAVGAGLSPVEFAEGQRRATAPQPTIGLPPPPTYRAIRYDDLVRVRSEVVSPVGRIVDVVA